MDRLATADDYGGVVVTKPQEAGNSGQCVDCLGPTGAETVIVNGRAVPNVTTIHGPEGQLHVSVGIHGFDCDVFDGEAILGLVADAVAVGAGFVGWPEPGGEFVPRPFAPPVHVIETADSNEPNQEGK